MVRPLGIILMLDEIVGRRPSTYQWLMHSLGEIGPLRDGLGLKYRVERMGAIMEMELFSAVELSGETTDEWPIAPDAGFSHLGSEVAAIRALPERRRHLTASTGSISACRIAAVFATGTEGVRMSDLRYAELSDRLVFQATCPDAEAEIVMALREGGELILRSEVTASGRHEKLEVSEHS